MIASLPAARSLYHQARILGSIAYYRFVVDPARDCDRSHVRRDWDFSSESEQLRHRRVMDALRSARTGRPLDAVLEIGCSEGIFTTALAPACRSLLAVDISPIALERATARCGALPNVILRRGNISDEWEENAYDVIVAMCVWEYLQGPDQHAAAARRLVAALRPGGILLINSTRLPIAYEDAWWARRLVVGGAQIARFLSARSDVKALSCESYPDYIIATFEKPAAGESRD